MCGRQQSIPSQQGGPGLRKEMLRELEAPFCFILASRIMCVQYRGGYHDKCMGYLEYRAVGGYYYYPWGYLK